MIAKCKQIIKPLAMTGALCYNIKAVSEGTTMGYSQEVKATDFDSVTDGSNPSIPANHSIIGVSPSGKATDSDSVIPKVRILPPQPERKRLLLIAGDVFYLLLFL